MTTPLLAKFIEAGIFERITVMIQREVALRLAAPPGTADYGAFTVFLGWHCEVERLFDVPPECFMPRPKVTSSVVPADAEAGASLRRKGRGAHVPACEGGLRAQAQDAA